MLITKPSTREPALMHPNQRACIHQQKGLTTYATASDSYAFFNLLTGPEFLNQVESLLPEHRERLFPPTETLSMFLAQAMSADRSCQNIVDAAAVKRLMDGMPIFSTHTGAYHCCPTWQAIKRLKSQQVVTMKV